MTFENIPLPTLCLKLHNIIRSNLERRNIKNRLTLKMHWRIGEFSKGINILSMIRISITVLHMVPVQPCPLWYSGNIHTHIWIHNIHESCFENAISNFLFFTHPICLKDSLELQKIQSVCTMIQRSSYFLFIGVDHMGRKLWHMFNALYEPVLIICRWFIWNKS